jgi:hypothetical protein
MKTKRTLKVILISILALAVVCGASVYGILRFAVPKSFMLSVTEKNLLEEAKFSYEGNYKAPNDWFKKRGLYWQKTIKNNTAGFEAVWDKEVVFNTVYFEEDTDGVVLFRMYAKTNSADEPWKLIYEQDRIGAQDICYTETVATTALRVEILETNSVVKLDMMAVYNLPKKDTTGFKVSQYLRMDNTDIIDKLGDSGFSGYYDVVTDVIIFEMLYVDESGDLRPYGGGIEENFDANFAALKTIIGVRNVRIWATVMFDQYTTGADGVRAKDLDKTTALLNSKRDHINASIKAFVDKYGFYGIDYDWEYPQKKAHWKAYEQIISDTAKYTKVSVAISPWHFDASKETIAKIEHFNVMCYDLFDSRMHHSTTAEAAFAAIGNVVNKLKIPREKILFGIPTYGRATNGSANSWPFYGETVQEIDGEFVGSLGKWSNKIQTFTYKEGGMEKSCAGYLNGYAIVRDKTLFALYADIGGVMIFRAKCDSSYDYEYSLHRAIKNTLDEFSK